MASDRSRDLAQLALGQLGKRGLGARAHVADHFTSGDRTEPTAGEQIQTPRQPEQETGRVEVSGPGRVDDGRDGLRVDDMDLIAGRR